MSNRGKSGTEVVISYWRMGCPTGGSFVIFFLILLILLDTVRVVLTGGSLCYTIFS